MIAQLELPASEPPSLPKALETDHESWLDFQQKVARHIARHKALWESIEAPMPNLGPAIPLADKFQREARANRQFAQFKSRLQQFPRSRKKRESWRHSLLIAMREMAANSLGLPGAGLELFFTRSTLEATRRFVVEAKAFDASRNDENLLQALRNLWVIHGIQSLLGKEMALCPATFAYSMLYPWTDNYLDDPQVPIGRKIGFGNWLEERLCGRHPAPRDGPAAQVGRLVAKIETHFPRAEFEEVYLSLRAIHRAQMTSLEQHEAGGSLEERDLLQITMRKGGTSVLADAYLVAGRLNESEADFMFGYGILLQLMDDLQDVDNDLANRHATLFVRQAAAGFLDEATSRLWSFGQRVLWSVSRFETPRFRPVKALMQESCKLLLFEAVARNHHFYTNRFVAEVENSSPFRFDFLRDREKSPAGARKNIVSLLRRRRQIDSAFDLLD
jgi:hypothetical protein